MQVTAVRTLRLLAMLVAAVALLIPGTALAHGHHGHRGHHHANRHDERDHGKGGLLYTTTTDPAGNAVNVYRRADDGSLSLLSTVPTGSPGLAAQPPFT